ncbi:hypothetical protein FZEAL_6670 [Fusarium zealandicum]|uniref:BZIP domain-containing protein n=1 Tax=Fusarium zealandicum TaxID=1053134 RepID=A0A8H4UI25_9HYPO|nr:hypothetical protein FZEAL_6670 [Fusarium zealandicum]
MANYNGRRGPNVSQYLRDLNAINRQETSNNDEPFTMEEDLALFTNTQFFDFETGQNTDYQAHPVKVDLEAAPSTSPSDGMTPAPSVVGDISNFEFIPTVSGCTSGRVWPAGGAKLDLSGWTGDGVYGAISRDFPAPITTSLCTPAPCPSLPKLERLLPQVYGLCYNTNYSSILHRTMAGDFAFSDFTTNNAYPSTPLNAFADGTQNFQSMQPNAPAAFPPIPQQQQQPHYAQQPAPQASAEKRNSESGPGAGRPGNFEEASRNAAEEDKRRRNTAASARFRIKKKQREQALEKSAKDMSDKVSSLESKVQQLEMENKWLKNLLVEKNEGNDEIVSLWKEFAASKTSGKSKSDTRSKSPVKEEIR